MADEQVAQTGGNSQEAPAATPSAEAQNVVATPPTGENPGANQGSENRIPQSRFNEVISERNRERDRVAQLESRLQQLESGAMGAPQKDPVIDAEVKRLVSRTGMSEEAAKEIVESSRNVARAERSQLELQQRMTQAEQWIAQKAQNDPMYKSLEPELDKSFNTLSPQMRRVISTDPEALEMFYDSVRARVSDGKAKEAFNKGASAAYENKATKAAVASVPGSGTSVKPALTREAIRKMSVKEFTERQSEINEAIKSGTLK